MNTTKRNKKRGAKKIKARILQTNLMRRFIRELEREEPLDLQNLHTILAFDPIPAR